MLNKILYSIFQRKLLIETRSINNFRKLCSGNDDNDISSSISNLSEFKKEDYIPRRILERQKSMPRKMSGSSSRSLRSSDIDENIRRNRMNEMLNDMVTGDRRRTDPNLEEFPSDFEEYQNFKEDTPTKKIIRPRIDPESTSITLFPGQGSQFVGMGKRLLTFPGVKELYDHASEILKYDLLKLCLYGPKSELNKTIYCQPAVFVTSIAAIEKLKEENFKGLESTVATAGFSVGEFAAMVFAEVMSFEDGLKIVNVRAKEMQKASEVTPSGMMTVFCFWGTKLKLAIQAAKEYCKTKHHIEDPICVVANYLFPEAKVLAGHEEALDFIAKNYQDFGIRRVKRIPVSGAFHSMLMESARKPVNDALKTIEMNEPSITLYSDVTSSAVRNNYNLNRNIVNQIIKPVKWEQIMYKLYMRDKESRHPYTYECGPGNQLGIFLQKINNKAYKNYRQIKV